ncbi:MAG: hypothetical protein ACOYK9_02085 [Chlamydiia bacterium]
MGLIYGSRFEDIEYLAPLIDILQLPLFVTEKEIEDRINRSFPSVNVTRASPNDLGKILLKKGNTIISCIPTSKIRDIFHIEEMMHKRRFHTVFLPHGFEEPLPLSAAEEKHLLVSGPKMIDELYSLSGNPRYKTLVSIGNYRELYFGRKELLSNDYDQYATLEEIKKRIIPLLEEIQSHDDTTY